MQNKKEILGQYFTRIDVVKKLIDLLLSYKTFDKKIKILEPSYGTGNFIYELKNRGFNNIDGCEIDYELTKNPIDFLTLPLKEKYDLIIGNPPFTKYNLSESYFTPSKYNNSSLTPTQYLPYREATSLKSKLENVFLFKTISHLKTSEDSTVAFILPISFFIKNRNKKLKKGLSNKFKTIVIYQNNETWFDYNIPCCFTIFTNSIEHENKIVLIYEDTEKHIYEFDKSEINEELIPEVIKNKSTCVIRNGNGIPLSFYLENKKVQINKSFTNYNVSAKNILEKTLIPSKKNIEDYKLAVVRVGNSSVGKAGLINIKEDVLNDMFFTFDLKNNYNFDKELKEKICENINKNIDYFKKITSRVGSKSIKKEDVFNFKIII